MDDVIVVGAGPAGLRCARLLEKQGLDVLVLEARKEIGTPIQCSGLVSRNLDRFLKPPSSCIEHSVKGALIHGPEGRELELMKPGTAAYVLDRQAFDSFLAGRVSSRILLDTTVKSLSVKGFVTVKTNKGEFRSRALLGCDGPSSVVRRHFRVKPAENLQGLIAITDKPDTSDKVELWLDRGVCDGFLWKIPRGETTEYGMLGSSVKFTRLQGFFKLRDVQEKRAGMIPVGPCKSYFDRTLLVGDAAAQTKPWSGGGVVYSMTCAAHATSTLTAALRAKDLSEQALSGYEQAWKAELDRPISMGMMGRELYKDMDNRALAKLMDSLRSMDLNSLDMDFPLLDF